MIVFRKRLKDRRKELRLTQEAFGKKIFLSKGEICAYEKGSRIPPLDVLIRMAKVLGVDFAWLIGMEMKYKKNENFIVNFSELDVKIIEVLKLNIELYQRLIDEPERTITHINNLINKN